MTIVGKLLFNSLNVKMENVIVANSQLIMGDKLPAVFQELTTQTELRISQSEHLTVFRFSFKSVELLDLFNEYSGFALTRLAICLR